MSERVRESFGWYQRHIVGPYVAHPEIAYDLDQSRNYFLFDVIPIPAPRMTQSDSWKTNPNHEDPKKRQRKVVAQYFEYKNELNRQAADLKFELRPVLDILFLIPMPDSWSGKKKKQSNKMPCKAMPDTDNLIKAFMDSFSDNDSFVWKITAQKIWAYRGSIIVFET